jgi:HipA-like kinase
MNSELYAVQHIRRMRGGSQAHLMRVSDGNYFVVKFQNNPQHIRVLANEMFASRLGQWLGLPVPRVEVIEVSDWLIRNSPDLRMEVGGAKTPCSSGPQLGSQHPDPELPIFDYLPESLLEHVANLDDFPRMLVLDKWAGNADGRQAVFTRKLRGRRYHAMFIDQGYSLNAGEWDFPDAALRGVYARNCVYASVTGWESFEPALTKAEKADLIDVWRAAECVPPEWYEHDHDGLERIVDTMYQRRSMIRDLIHAFRASSRNPFPNWKQN